VVVAVDEAGGGEAAVAVDPHLLLALGRRRGAGADGVDEPVAHDDVAAGVLGAAPVDGGDRAALDHQARHRAPSAASRTASRIFS
jgi:hypothetical protein